MRTQGILLVREAAIVLNSPSADRKTDSDVSLWAAADLYHTQMLKKRTGNGNHVTS